MVRSLNASGPAQACAVGTGDRGGLRRAAARCPLPPSARQRSAASLVGARPAAAPPVRRGGAIAVCQHPQDRHSPRRPSWLARHRGRHAACQAVCSAAGAAHLRLGRGRGPARQWPVRLPAPAQHVTRTAALRACTTFYSSAPYMLRPVRDTRSFALLAHPPFTNSSFTNPRCPWPALLLIATTSTALRRRQHQHQQRPRCSTRSPPRPWGAASFVSQSVKGPASYLKYGMTSVTRLD